MKRSSEYLPFSVTICLAIPPEPIPIEPWPIWSWSIPAIPPPLFSAVSFSLPPPDLLPCWPPPAPPQAATRKATARSSASSRAFVRIVFKTTPNFKSCSDQVPCSGVTGAKKASEPEHLKLGWRGGWWRMECVGRPAKRLSPRHAESDTQWCTLGEQPYEQAE